MNTAALKERGGAVMQKFFRLVFLSVSAAFLGLFFVAESYAYLDPGSGSHMLQILTGIVFGVIFALKIFWSRIKMALKNFLLKSKKK